MKHLFALLIAIGYSCVGFTQVSVFDCSVNGTIEESDITSGAQLFERGCIDLNSPNGYLFNGNENNIVQSSSYIHLAPGFHAGAFSSAGQIDLKIGNNSALDIAVMNYNSLNSIKRYKKLELGVTLPEPYQTYIENFAAKENNPNLTFDTSVLINPFLEWELDVEGYFYQPGTNQVIKVDGYYTRDLHRNTATNRWDETSTDYHMRIRFAPPANGNWVGYVTVKIDNQVISTSNNFYFKVIESGDEGYVTVHPNNRNFQRNGELIYPVGQNLILDTTDLDEWYSNVNNSNFCAPVSCWSAFLHNISKYANMGGKYMRHIETPYFNMLEWEKKGNYYNRLHYAYETDNMLDTLDKYDILCIYNLMIQEPFMLYGDYNKWQSDWDHYFQIDSSHIHYYDPNDPFPINPYNDNPGVKMPHEMFLNESDLQYHEQRTRYTVARYGYSTKIYVFEPLSEPYHLDQMWKSGTDPQIEPYLIVSDPTHAIVLQAVENYTVRIASYIKGHLEHTTHLIGVDAVESVWKPELHLVNHDNSIYSSSIDVIGINPYNNNPNKLFLTDDNNYPSKIGDFSISRTKPVYMAEGGHEVNDCSSIEMTSGSVEVLDNMTLGFTGFAGLTFWHTFLGDEYNLWEQQARTKDHMNAHTRAVLSRVNGYWAQYTQLEKHIHGDEKPLKENMYYVSEDQEMASGFLRNRTFNMRNEVAYDTASPCYYSYLSGDHDFYVRRDIQWNDGSNPLKAEHLKNNTDYMIEYYNYGDGSYLASECKNSSSFGNLTLEHPALLYSSALRPVIWYIIYEYNCDQNKMAFVENGKTITSAKDQVLVFPNPIKDVLHFTAPGQGNFIVYDLLGTEIFRAEYREGEATVPCEFLNSGQYCLKVFTSTEVYNKYFIKL